MDAEMGWEEALEIVVARTGHEAYRRHCADDHPERDIWRRRMVQKATGVTPPTDVAKPIYPPLIEQAGNALAAAGRVISALAGCRAVLAPADVVASRRAICMPCEFNGEKESGGFRCTRCGCGGKKLELATESCPEGKWATWEAPKDVAS